jgi:ubiquinone biosynthesis protein Coq4
MDDKTESGVSRMVDRSRRWYYLRNNLRSFYAAFRLARNPEATKYVFMIGDAQDNIAESERRLGTLPDPFECSELEALWQAGYRPARYDIDELARLPSHTLGGAYGRHMLATGLRADYYLDLAPRHRMQFLRQRMRQTHDIWHVLTGLGTDEFDEVAIQGFYAGQYTSSMAGIIAAGAFLKSIARGRFGELRKHIDAFCEGYCAGKRADNLLAVKWEDLWSESLESLRRRYRIHVPGRTENVRVVRELKAVA